MAHKITVMLWFCYPLWITIAWCSSVVSNGTTLRVCNQVFVVLFRRSTGRQHHLVPSPVSSPIIALITCCALVVSAACTWVLLFLVTPKELDSVARMRTDFDCLQKLLCSASKNFISGLASLSAVCVLCAKRLMLEKLKLGVFTP